MSDEMENGMDEMDGNDAGAAEEERAAQMREAVEEARRSCRAMMAAAARVRDAVEVGNLKAVPMLVEKLRRQVNDAGLAAGWAERAWEAWDLTIKGG